MNYSASYRECLAVLWALKKMRLYLLYDTFYTIISALHSLLTIEDPIGHLMRWLIRLAKYNFEVRYRKGKANTQADALSRLHTEGETIRDENDDIPTFVIDEDLTNYDKFVDVLHKEYKEEDFTEPEYADFEELIAAMDDPAPPTSTSNPSPSKNSSLHNLTISFMPKYATVLTRGRG